MKLTGSEIFIECLKREGVKTIFALPGGVVLKIFDMLHQQKDVEVICWGCKCEPFCVPGPGCPTCRHCQCVCPNCEGGCDPEKVHSQAKRFVWTDWVPSFAQMYTRTKLMKKTEKVKVPTYKWVVEEVCCDCASNCGYVEPAEAKASPSPAPVMPK